MKYVLYDLNIVLVLGHEKALNHPQLHFAPSPFYNRTIQKSI